MKKIMISLLMVAASISAMAITYTGRAQLTLTSSDNKSCTLGLVESEDLVAGLNEGRYAELNTEGKEVLFYVVYEGKNYEAFASNAATMKNLPLGIQTNASTTYTLTAENVIGSLVVKINGVDYTINANGTIFSDLALPASSTLPAAGDEAKYRVQPYDAPVIPSICFSNNQLDVIGHEGESLVITNLADDSQLVNEAAISANYSKNFDADALPSNTRLLVTLNGVKYRITVNPVVTPYVEPVP